MGVVLNLEPGRATGRPTNSRSIPGAETPAYERFSMDRRL